MYPSKMICGCVIDGWEDICFYSFLTGTVLFLFNFHQCVFILMGIVSLIILSWFQGIEWAQVILSITNIYFKVARNCSLYFPVNCPHPAPPFLIALFCILGIVLTLIISLDFCGMFQNYKAHSLIPHYSIPEKSDCLCSMNEVGGTFIGLWY